MHGCAVCVHMGSRACDTCVSIAVYMPGMGFPKKLSPWARNLFCIRFPLMLQPAGFLGTGVQG